MKIDYAGMIRQRVDALDCAEYYGIHVDREGFAVCPFHDGDRSPSMKIYPNGRGWHCFGCGVGGSVIDMVMKMYGLPFHDAMAKLNDDFKLGLDISGRTTPSNEAIEAQKEEQRRRELYRRSVDAANQKYNDALSAYVLLDKTINQCEPGSPEWTEAVKQLPAADYDLTLAEIEVNRLIGQSNDSITKNTRLDGRTVSDHNRTV